MKQSLNSNSFTKEVRPRTGRLKGAKGFGIGKFGSAKFSEDVTGYEQTKEALSSNSHTKEALSSNSLTKEALSSNSHTKEALSSKIT